MARPKKTSPQTPELQTMALGMITNPEFTELFNRLMNEQMPMAAAYSLLILQDELKTHSANYETLRKKLIVQHGELDADGNVLMNEEKTSYKIKDMAAFNSDFFDLMNIHVPVSKIPLSHLESLKLTPANLKLLMDSIVKK